MKYLQALGQQGVHFALGDNNAQVPQLLEDQLFGDTLVVVLIEEIADQGGGEVSAGDGGGRWQRGEDRPTIGGLVAWAAIEDIVGFNFETLNERLLVILEDGALREIGRG
jgi:hypothetical protein